MKHAIGSNKNGTYLEKNGVIKPVGFCQLLSSAFPYMA
jgi:hypothetical protein